jgi:hypothetical protein
MLVKCANASCLMSFRYLNVGKLFRLEQGAGARSSHLRTTEYFWLCDRCSLSLTLGLMEDGGVMTVELETAHQDPSHVACAAVNRRGGLLLSTVCFLRCAHQTESGANSREDRDVISLGAA